MLKYLPLAAVALVIAVTFLGCDNRGEHSRYKAYVYREPTPDGLVCIFYANSLGVAEGNAQRYITFQREANGVTLTTRPTPY